MSFAYETGPAYGLLLDMDDENWRKSLTTSSSLSDKLRIAAKIELPADLAASALRRAEAYDGKELILQEENRERVRQETEAGYRKTLVDGPVLEVPVNGANYTYDPNKVFMLGDLGRVFPGSQISGDWGVLEVEKAVRVAPQFDWAYVPAPKTASEMMGDGWKLTLKPGWRLAPGKRKGDFRIVKS
jgi:hypothetical protein